MTDSEELKGEINLRQQWWTVAAVWLCLLMVEAGMRMVQSKLSVDLLHYAEMPERLTELSKSPPLRIWFVGNSLTREGVDEDRFRSTWVRQRQDSQNVTLARWNPDDTSIIEWRHLIADALRDRDKAPAEVLVLSYAQNQMADRTSVNARRLGSLYLNANNAADILRQDTTTFSSRSELFLSAGLSSFASAERFRTRILAKLVPHYEETAQRLNQAVTPELPPNTEGRTYERLEQILDLVKSNDMRLVAVAIPTGEPFPIDPKLIELLRIHDSVHIDGHQLMSRHDLPQLDPTHDFPDGYHMGEEAAERFSTALALEMSQRLP